jgi:hypothetical protein
VARRSTQENLRLPLFHRITPPRPKAMRAQRPSRVKKNRKVSYFFHGFAVSLRRRGERRRLAGLPVVQGIGALIVRLTRATRHVGGCRHMPRNLVFQDTPLNPN